MTQKVRAIFENGVFRPVESIRLSSGMEVELTVQTDDNENNTASSIGALNDELDRIAALPIEGDAHPFSGADHDQILYGKHGAR
jgi:predicted DNA-binding antitoxin AbrB/MazE fold protein